MTLARTVLLSALLTSCASGAKPPPTDTAALGPATWTPLPPASDAPFDTSRPPAEFWKLGQAACPEGASFSPAEAPYFQASCTRDGTIDGPTATFDAEGHLLVLERYERGQAVGQHLAYWQNGKLRREQAWLAGKEHGPFTRWYEDGQKAESGTYRDGRLDGPIAAWDAKGRPLPTSTVTNGTGRYVEYHPDGTPAQERSFVDGREHGTRTQWSASGRKLIEQQIDHGVQHGSFAEWDASGQPLRRGHLANDKETGAWTFYGPGGAITRVDTYADGDVVASVTYQDGKPLGKPAADAACTTPEGVARVYQASTGAPLKDGDDHCVRRAVHFPGVIAIGNFANDRGCASGGVIVDCKYQAQVDGGQILARAGWKRANPAMREQIARHYVAEVGLVWNMRDEPSEATRAANGDILVRGSVTIVGMRGSSSYSTEFRFTPAGAVTSRSD